MARKVIDVGLSNNDGTGDSIRDSFKKVNDNFQELYGSLGLGERLSFRGLEDTPGSYLNQQGKLLVVNQTQDGLEFRSLLAGTSMAIDYDNVTGSITLRPLNQDVVNDTTPQLGGNLDARSGGVNYKIFNLPAPSGPTDAVNKSYADTKISLSGVDAVDPETGLTNEAFGTMTGPLVLSRNPVTADDDDYDGLIAATKRYVDRSSFSSTTSLYVNLGGSDNRTDLSEDKQGRSPAYAFRTLEKALKECERIIAESPFELSVYKKKLVYNNGLPCTLTKIETALIEDPLNLGSFIQAGSGAVIIPRMLIESFTLRNPGTGYKAGDVIQIGLPSNPGTFTSRASVKVLRVSNVNGAILTYEIVGRGNYTGLPGVLDVGSTLSVPVAGSVGAGATFDLTYSVAELSVTGQGSGYGPVSIRISAGGGEGAAATAIVSNGSIIGTTLLSGGGGYTSLPTVQVFLPRLFVFTNGARTDFSSSLDPLAQDIREGLGIRGITSGAIAEILSHNASLDDTLSGYPTGTGKNELFDVGVLSGWFIDGEELEYGELIKTKQITVQVESGSFEENYPLRVSNNVSIIGEEFRRTLIRPKPGISTSPYTQIFFRRDPIIDNIRVTGLYGINLATNTTAALSARTGTITVTLGSPGTNTNWIGKIWKCIPTRGEGVVTQILSSTQFKVRIHDDLDSTATIAQGAIFVGTISSTTLTVESVTSGTITVGMEINAIGATTIPIGIKIEEQLTGAIGGTGTYRLNKGYKLPNSTSIFGSNWQIYTVNEYGFHYLTDPSRPIYPLLENIGRNVNAATLLKLNKLFIQEEVIAYVNRTYAATGYNEELCKRDIGLIIDAIAYDLIYGGYTRSVEAALKYYQSVSGLIAIGLTGTPESGFLDIISNSQKSATLGAISFAATLADQTVRNNSLEKFNINPEAVQIINFSLTREPLATGIIAALMNTIYQMLDDPRNVNFPKDNREMDVFLCNDANILRQITIQGHGGFAQVLDPEGQILNKSPYSQQGSVFSASNNKQRFAGGMFIDGYTGNQYFRIRSKTTSGPEANYVFEIDKLYRRPQLPCTFVVQGIVYKVNYLRNFVYSSGPNGSSATLVLDSSSPYPDAIAGIITGCTATGNGTHATITFPSVRGFAPFTVGNQIDVSGFGGDAAGYNGIHRVTECTTTFVRFVSGETDPGTGGTVAENFELITAGYRSLLSNDWTQLNDMGYGLFVTNGGISEAVGMFTYYCYTAYFSLNGGQIRSVGGSAAHGVYALRAEGSDPKEIPDDCFISRDFIQSVKTYAIGQYGNARGDNELYITNYNYEPLADSQLEVLHYRTSTARDGIAITGMTQSGTKTVLTVAGANSHFQSKDHIQITGIVSSSQFSTLFNYQRNVSDSFSGVFRIDAVDATTITIDFPSTGASGFAGITVTGGSWTDGTATLTFANQTFNPYVVGQKFIISGVAPAGYNNSGTAVTLTAVTPTSISYALASNPGAWVSGGALPAMVRATGVRRDYAINSIFYGDGSSGGGIPDQVARVFLEPITTNPGETGLYAAIGNNDPVTIRQSRKLWLDGVSGTSVAKASTALLFDDDDPDFDVNDVITYSTGDLARRTGGYQEAFANLRESYRYIQITAKFSQRKVGNLYYGAVGSSNISVNTITDQFDIAKLATGNYSFHWYGVEYITTGYTPAAGPDAAYITLDKPLQHPISGYQSETTLQVGPKYGVTGSITIKISTLRATAFDLLDIGSGSYADTNYPNNIFGPSVNANKPDNEAAEIGKGRVFYTTIDQEGNFKVGKLFGINQSTGEATLSARISLSNISSLQLSQGVPINEFTADPNFSSPSGTSVATELATKLYIDRRLGHDGSDKLNSDRIGPGFIDTTGKNFMVDNFNMNNAGRIINMKNPTALDDAVTYRWLSLPHLNGNNGSVTIPNCTVSGNGTTATVTFGGTPIFASAPFVAGQIIGITGFTNSGFNTNKATVITCNTTTLTYANTTNASSANGIISAAARGNLLVYTGTNTTDIDETNVARDGFTNATVIGDIDVTLNDTLRTINFQLVGETIVNADISQSAAIEQKKLNLSNAVATTNSSLSVSATASGNIVTLTYASQSDAITGLATVPFAAGTRIVISGFANNALNGTFVVRSTTPTPSNTTLGYDCPALNNTVITTPVTGGTVIAERGLSTFNTANFTVSNGHVTVKDNGLQLAKLVKVANNRVIGYTGGDATGNATEVELTTVVSAGGAILLNQYNNVGVLFASVGGPSTTPTRPQMRVLFANHNVLGPGGTAGGVAGADAENTVRNLVARDTNGDTDLRNLRLEGSLRMSRPGVSALGNDAEYVIADLAAVTSGKSTVIYAPGTAGNRGSIVLSVSDAGTVADYNLYKNAQHRFQDRDGSYDNTHIITKSISTNPDLSVSNTAGQINGKWTLRGTSSFEATYADLAEYYEADREYEVGTVLVFGGDKEVTTSNVKADHRVAGVVSNTAAYTMNQACPGIKTCVALQGRVPVKVVGKVNKGDLIVTSGIPGVAMAATGDVKVGTLIGKAIGSYNSDRIGTVEVSVGRT